MSGRRGRRAGSRSGCGEGTGEGGSGREAEGRASAMQGGVPAEEQGSISDAGKRRDRGGGGGIGLTKCIEYVQLCN